MGVNSYFQEDFLTNAVNRYLSVCKVDFAPFEMIMIKEKVYVHLVPLENTFTPEQLLSLQAVYQQQGLMLVHLWEDIWVNRKSQVLSRIDSFCGLNKTLHGRKARIIELQRNDVELFLNDNHLQGYIKTKYNYGLEINHELVAVACFSQTRPMKTKGEHYKSSELIRFATLAGYTVVGGLSKLIKHFLTQVDTNDLMTYADRDWSLGKGYEQLKFSYSGNSKPTFFYVEPQKLVRYATHRLPKQIQLKFNQQNILNLDDFLSEIDFIKIFNTGNLKYHLYLNGS